MSRSAAASTYTWQLPTPVSITGTVDSSTTDWIRPAPPRGISTSTRPRARISSLTVSRDSAGHQLDDVGRQPGARDARRAAPPRAPRCCRGRSTLPRSSTALPRLEADPGGVDGDVGAGLVDHPDHAERAPGPGAAPARWPACSPRTTSPTGSGRPARSRSPSAIAATRSAVSRSRSTMWAGVSAASARRTSTALAASTSSVAAPGRRPSPAAPRPWWRASPARGRGSPPGHAGPAPRRPAGCSRVEIVRRRLLRACAVQLPPRGRARRGSSADW